MISFILVVFCILFYLSSCAPTAKPEYGFFDWESTTTDPYGIWESSTTDFFDWWLRRTKKPINKYDYTPSPNDDDYTSKSTGIDPLFILIVVVPVTIAVIISICKCFISGDCTTESSDVSSHRTLHLPPTNRTYTSTNTRMLAEVHRPPTFSSREGTELSFVNSVAAFSTNSNVSNSIYIPRVNQHNNPPRTNSTLPTVDKPPDYATVIHSDLSEPDTKFPSLKPKEPESPPPNYNAENVPKY